MDYRIALPPDLGLSAAGFVAAWNEAAECTAVAEARLAQPTRTQYDPTLLEGAFVALGSVALGVVSNVIYDLIKGVLAKKGIRKRMEVRQLDQPDGSRLLVVTIVEE